MFKFFFAAAIVAVFTIQNVSAGDCCCGEGAAPAATDQQAKATDAQGTEQAQRSSESRSYSYEPEATPAYEYQYTSPAEIDGFYAGRINQDPRIIGSFGHRPASDKNLGNY